jgi:regulation of enolase protein 1 (concanavalin A-like superfamily)
MLSFKELLKVSVEETNYNKFIRKVVNPKTGKYEWAFIDIHNPKKVFKFFGDTKPTEAQIKKELKAIEYFKNK